MLESRPDDELTLEFTKKKLLDEHTRRVESSKDESTASKALKSLHGASSQKREKEKKFCSFCHKPNHSKEECWHYQKRNNSNKEYKYENFRRGNVPKYTNQSSVTQEQSTNQRTTKGPNPKALNCSQREASVHNWFIDSGATSHMAYDESFFTELNREQTQNVVVANGNKLQVKGIGQGEIKVITPQGKTDTLLLTKVLYIPELTDNLLSVSAATSNGCKVTFNRDWCTIERDHTALANGILDNGIYRLHLDDNLQTRTFKANVAKQNHCKNKNCLMLWHDRLGHRNIESIKKIRNENLARGLSLNNCSHSTDCVQCIQGKLTETPFPKKTEYRATETLQLVHSDICGPLPTNSLSGKRYFITFTDDYSRYTKTYLLKGKDEAYEKIKDYVISAHTEFGKNIQTIRTDNGREYVNRQVEDFLNQSGIKHQLTVPYSPAQNGVAERKNRSLMEMTRCMLFDSGLPQSLWAEAVTTANYLHNRIPSKATDKTPFELWTNRKPSLKHLKRFGCKAFAYIPKIKRNKLDSKVIEGIFLGYDDRSKGYRILHDTDNITISRSVKFLEKENGFHLASTKTTSLQVLSTDLTSSNHIGDGEESQEPGTQSENLEDSETEDYLQPGTSTGTQVVTQRRSTRPTKGIPPIRNDYMLYKTEAQDIPTPTSYSEVLQLPKIEREKWLQAMNEELNSLEKNNVWELTPLPKDKKIIGCKWTYKQKLNSKGEIERYKARLVAKGFNQKFGRDYEETFAPIVKHSTIRAFLTASVYKGMQVIHLDVQTAFLHGDLDKEPYMELPEGLHTKQTNEVCKLKKAIYGLKQAGRSWNTKIASTLLKNNFKQSIVDPCLFTKNEENHSIYLILYVDDMLLASDSEIIIQNTVKTLEKEFEIKNLGDPTQFIGIEISRNREGELLLSQKNKIQELVERYNLQEAKPTFTPMESGYPGISDEKLLQSNVQYQQLIGSLLYLSVVSRPDIAAPVCILSSRNQNPRNCDWNAAKRIVRYLKTTKELELRISNQKPPTLEAYIDATWASDNTDRKSLSGNLFLLGSNPISWMTGKQGCVSLSSTEAELISAAEASQELLWLLDLLKDLELEQKAPIYFHQDNQSCLKICSSEKVSSRTKHIATKIHHLKGLQKKTVIKMVYCPTGDMKADILTKPLPRPTFEKLRYNLVIATLDLSSSQLFVYLLLYITITVRYHYFIVKIPLDPVWISWNKVRPGLKMAISPKPWSLVHVVQAMIIMVLSNLLYVLTQTPETTRPMTAIACEWERTSLETKEDYPHRNGLKGATPEKVKMDHGEVLRRWSIGQYGDRTRRKRRQFKQTDAFTRGMVIGLKRAGWSIRQIAADTHLGASTVHRLWRRWLEQGNVAIYRNAGATRVTSARVDRRILRQAVAAPQATCTAILQHVQDTLDHFISTRTISRRLVDNGLHSCRPLRRLPLTPPNRRQRLEWCRARSTWMTEWHRVVFSDESRFCLSNDSRRVRLWRRRGERSNPAAIVERPTVRQRGIMGTMTAQRYVDDVLRPVTFPYLQGVPNALYQQDNARPLTARISQQALQDVQMLP
ncbi:hypothetical protein LAZ67_4003928 [Cordylochernes scorpioides]|uniref:Integrase catalytic domain-containing protein n=1 Tax=Cordylochernes scorpioides TaxID=51811 RepID=A0ABY6KHK6_9ARAC|nr:hypothetical protein LAZ67_4003928 [Cordylochernes scorpioides]